MRSPREASFESIICCTRHEPICFDGSTVRTKRPRRTKRRSSSRRWSPSADFSATVLPAYDSTAQIERGLHGKVNDVAFAGGERSDARDAAAVRRNRREKEAARRKERRVEQDVRAILARHGAHEERATVLNGA